MPSPGLAVARLVTLFTTRRGAGLAGLSRLPKLDCNRNAGGWIYRGEDSIVRHWLKAPWNMDGWRLDVGVHMLGEAGGARHNLQHVAGVPGGKRGAA